MERIVRQAIERNKPWTDDSFPPERKSLYDPKIDQVDAATYNSLSWKRASEIYNPIYVFEDGVDPNDVC